MNNYMVVGIERVFIIFFKLLGIFILMKYLSVEDMGIIALLAMFLGISTLLIDSGFSGALLRKKEIKTEDYDFLFTNALLISILVYLISFSIAIYIEQKNHIINFTLYTTIIMLIVFLKIKNIVGYLYLIEKKEFRMQANINNISLIVGFLVLFIGLLFNFKIYAYIMQNIAEALMINFLYNYKIKIKSKLNFAYKENIEVLKIGYSTLISSTIRTLYDNYINFIILNIYGIRNLGLYSQANRVNTLFISSFMGVVDKVSFVSFSKDKDEKAIKDFNLISIISIIVSFIVLLLILLCIKSIISKFFSHQWLSMIPILTYTVVIAFLSVGELNIRTLIKAKLSAKKILINEIFKKIIGIIIIIFSLYSSWDIDLFFKALVVNAFISVAVSLASIIKFLQFNLFSIFIFIILNLLALFLLFIGWYLNG